MSMSVHRLLTTMYGRRMSKWKAGVSSLRFLSHFFPPANSRPSPNHGRRLKYVPICTAFGSERPKRILVRLRLAVDASCNIDIRTQYKTSDKYVVLIIANIQPVLICSFQTWSGLICSVPCYVLIIMICSCML